jgi:uncharacterized membrane protein
MKLKASLYTLAIIAGHLGIGFFSYLYPSVALGILIAVVATIFVRIIYLAALEYLEYD